jgi:hypothetical protein
MAQAYPGLRANQVRARSEALARFAEWERNNPPDLSPAVALAGVASLYELLPKASRVRAVDVAGVAVMQRALRVLTRTNG